MNHMWVITLEARTKQLLIDSERFKFAHFGGGAILNALFVHGRDPIVCAKLHLDSSQKHLKYDKY